MDALLSILIGNGACSAKGYDDPRYATENPSCPIRRAVAAGSWTRRGLRIRCDAETARALAADLMGHGRDGGGVSSDAAPSYRAAYAKGEQILAALAAREAGR